MARPLDSYDIAVLIPCYNEELTVAAVIQSFRKSLPQAKIYVYDNNSRDRTAEIAAAEGALVRSVKLQGKGNVIRRMFADIDADIYVMADGDVTYSVDRSHELVEKLIEQNLDTVIGVREADHSAFPRGHVFGNALFNRIVKYLFGQGLTDVFSGFRVFSHRFAKTFPSNSRGFETETEMSIHILEMRLPFAEMRLPYYNRPEGSFSKLNTYRDGMRILLTMLSMFRETKPLIFFGLFGLFLILLSLALGTPVILNWLETGTVPRLPTAILATGLTVIATLSFACGLVLDGISRSRREALHMRYLMFQSHFARTGR